jgi:NAD(P)-dependent dehydrogenase (short-subunit alcohol dehydrogenase family)
MATATRYGLQGRVVVVTGAGGGIGRALAEAFAAQEAELILIDRAQDALMQVATDLSGITRVNPHLCDLSSDAAVAAMTSALTAQLARQQQSIYTLVNNAGAEYPTPLSSGAPDAMERWAALLDNNVSSMTRLTRALLPLMGEGSSIINQASIWGKTGVADFSAYVASKHAVIGLTRALAWELGARGIRVNAVCPGWIRTDAAMASLRSMAQTQGRSEAVVERDILAGQALPGMLAPADIAGVYLFLASHDARCMTGQSLVASNGEVMA